eukprot:GHUV01012254.1.p1 GENE.GHUV01012254.1~~GHUV01012254.1.p1  ORF type:complete len:229 (+),score=53.92 GHUV01012254.1:239-925(+)
MATTLAAPSFTSVHGAGLDPLALLTAAMRCEDLEGAASGPQGQVLPFMPINDPCVWTASSWDGRHHEFVYTLTTEDLQELSAATTTFIAASTVTTSPKLDLSTALVHMNKSSFPLPQLGPKLLALADSQLRPEGGGRGFQLLRGLPMDKWTKTEAFVAYMGISAHMGYNFSPQRKDGKMVHHLKALNGGGVQYAESTQSAAMGFHTDAQGDALGLLCLQQAEEGGESR